MVDSTCLLSTQHLKSISDYGNQALIATPEEAPSVAVTLNSILTTSKEAQDTATILFALREK